ncbi:cilia- and flagella-associated protein 221 [Hippoglossus stenolepis]|uniref:cilia- and flagella-associated protein 221 n=1 Tax=Hippoglossus stenolepis TaxID=195615 RepID=UPI001FAF3F19|nr:cilia- and flagella-associated protein 221 [Hippoglossus stenolepis]
MDVALSGPQTLSEPLRRGTPLPLSQLVELNRSRAHVPNHLLESKIYAKLKSNSLVEAEPPELHFSGFELGQDYVKNLKLINVSSEVLNIHIIPTQTRHFQSTYTKKCRLIPGLAYTVKVGFCPDEWRYFYDCIRVHCEGEENLLIPVHAYPVIDDLHIPPHIDLSAVPLGQSVTRVIPLRSSCPIDFEFQAFVLQPHEAFSIHPLAGVIPASGEVKLTVTFSPLRYETSQVTIQLVVSQFNSKPFLCTITGSAVPLSGLSRLESKSAHGDAAPPEHRGPSPAAQLPPRSKTRCRSNKEADKSKSLRDLSTLKPVVDVLTPAGVAKMLIKNTNKLSSKALKEAMSCGSLDALQNRQMKEALFVKRFQQNVKEEQANHFSWQVHLGRDPVSGQSRRQRLEEREAALQEYTVKWRDGRREEKFRARQTKLSSAHILQEAGQAPEGAPSFQLSTGFQWEMKQRALQPFQEAARKVGFRCRINRRLACFRKLASGTRRLPAAQKAEEKTSDVKISPDKVFPFAFPTFCDEGDPLAHGNLVTLPVAAVDVAVTTRIPFFKLQVPQHYKLMGYRPVSSWEAFNSYTPPTLARPLRTAPQPEEEVEVIEVNKAASLSFTAPDDLLRPRPANPLRIFNPAPGLQAYKPAPKYLESDLEFHLCPLPRFTAPESNTCGTRAQSLHTQKDLLDRKEVIKGIMTWKNFDPMALKFLSDHPAPPSSRRLVDYNTDILPLPAPPPLTALPDDLTPLMDKPCDDSGVQLTPEMIRAQFLPGEAPVSHGNPTAGAAARYSESTGMTST